MDETLPLDAEDQETAEMRSAIAQWLAGIEELRSRMRRHDEAIEKARKETHTVLAEIAEALAELKAA